MEYYFQLQLCQYVDSLDVGPYVVCFLAEAVDFPSIQNIRPALGSIGPPVHWMLWDPSLVMKQLMHEADHSPLFSAEATDQCSCNCAPPKCLHGVHRDIFTFYHCFGGMTPISMCT
jgi:hypothetical protein